MVQLSLLPLRSALRKVHSRQRLLLQPGSLHEKTDGEESLLEENSTGLKLSRNVSRK